MSQSPTTKFKKELESLINRYSFENASNTPDFILAEYLFNCLKAFDTSVTRRDLWYGRFQKPGGGSGPDPEGPSEDTQCFDGGCDENEPSIKYLCYYQLHVDDSTFYMHVIVEATSSNEALEKLESRRGDSFHLQAKGCLGPLSLELVEKYLMT